MQFKAVLLHAQHWIVSACKITYVKSAEGGEVTGEVPPMALYDARLPSQSFSAAVTW